MHVQIHVRVCDWVGVGFSFGVTRTGFSFGVTRVKMLRGLRGGNGLVGQIGGARTVLSVGQQPCSVWQDG